jgi:ABC-type bacteriocin/lantibiotic exporter with double-glycine peptidase domain
MAAPDFEGQRADQHESLLRQTLACLRQFIVQERRLLIILIQYAVVVGFFSLIVPLTVQEMVNTFAFAIQPIMVATLIAIMAAALLFRGAFRVLQFYATDVLERRLFVRVTLALASQLLRFKQDSFRVRYINHFFETVFMQRALSSLLVDFINIVVGGIIGMTLLVFYHPYFLFSNFFLVGSAVDRKSVV